jgi:hypothetical protein
MLDSVSEGAALKLGGGLLVVGLVLNAVVTSLWHPGGSEDHHVVIFAKYAKSGGWIATHLAQFVLVLVALAGVFALAVALRRSAPLLALLVAGGAVATAAAWAVLQAIDGVALKQAVDSWFAASGPQNAVRFANAETARWAEQGLQCYFRALYGLTLLGLGAALLAGRQVASWLGAAALLAGALSIAYGIDVAYVGFEGGFLDAALIAFQVVLLIFAVGVLMSGRRHRGARTAAGR